MQPWVCVKKVVPTGTVTTPEFRLWKGEVFWWMVRLFRYEIELDALELLFTLFTQKPSLILTSLTSLLSTLFTGFLKYNKNDLDDMILLKNNNLYTYSPLLT